MKRTASLSYFMESGPDAEIDSADFSFGERTNKKNGFTLTEVLVTISVIGLLMGILLPAVQCIRKHANTIGCRSNQRQWGIAFTMDDEPASYLDRFQPWLRVYMDYDRMKNNALRTDANDIYLCPSAKKKGRSVPSLAPEYMNLQAWDGSKSRAWAYKFMGQLFISSYSVNDMREYLPKRKTGSEERRSEVPILFDCTFRLTGLQECDDPPPQYDDMPRAIPTYKDTRACGICIDRHNGGINILFMDSSVRKVDLKELWILQWNEQYNKTGPWTKAGGVQPHDWPHWMRKFKDH